MEVDQCERETPISKELVRLEGVKESLSNIANAGPGCTEEQNISSTPLSGRLRAIADDLWNTKRSLQDILDRLGL